MVSAVKPAYDMGGFGRLADVRFKKRAEAREERRLSVQERNAEQSYRLGEIQIKQTEANLAKIKKQSDLKIGLGKALTNIPEGENQFTTAYNYYMMQGESETAQKYMDAQSDRIEDIYKMDKEAGINAYNETIGRSTGNTLEYVKEDPVQGDILKMKDNKSGKIVYGSRTKSGKFVPLPGDYTPVDDTKRTKTVVDLELEDAVTEKFKTEQKLSDTDARLKAQAFISENKKGKGISISTDKDGNQVISIGGKVQGGDLTRGAKTGVQKDLIESNKTHSNMKAIVSRVEDRFLELDTRLGAKATELREKWNKVPGFKWIGEPTEDQKKTLEEYTDFRREAIASLNSYIKQITGAAMSELEAKRLMKAMPNPGMGLFDGDSPTQFKTKLNGVMKSLDRAIARQNYVLNHGLNSIEDVGLDGMDGIIDRRGEALEKEIRNADPLLDNPTIEKQVIQTLSEEFGIRF